MTETTHRTIYRKDYTPPDYTVDSIELRFELGDETTLVTSRVALRRHADAACPLVLGGKNLTLHGLTLDGEPLAPERYTADRRPVDHP